MTYCRPMLSCRELIEHYPAILEDRHGLSQGSAVALEAQIGAGNLARASGGEPASACHERSNSSVKS